MSKLPQFARFWMICRKPAGPNARTEPRQRYSSFNDAEHAASQLAESTGAPHLILESVAIIRPGDNTQKGLFP